MTRSTIAAAIVILLVLLALAAGYLVLEENETPVPVTSSAVNPWTTADEEVRPGFLYGRVTTVTDTTYEGRLRWGGDEEAFWGDYFNGVKDQNPWVAYVPSEALKTSHPFEIFGIEIIRREGEIDLQRPFMARFGNIARIEGSGFEVRVALKSGTVFVLDRLEADDFADGVRVWDERHGVVDLAEWRIRSIELLPTPRLDPLPARLHGTVRTQWDEFTGFLQWNREKCVGSDELEGRTADGPRTLRFDTIRSIARRSPDSSLVTLVDGREIVLSGSREVGRGNRGVYVHDVRYGRVLVSWDAFQHVEFSPGGSGPGYDDFPPGRALTGTVTTRAGRRLVGRLVYDLDESETTETLDAPSRGVDYTLPFAMISSIELPGQDGSDVRSVRVILHGGEELSLEPAGDLGPENAGMLVFVEGRGAPEYLPWTEVGRVKLESPPAL